MAALCSPFLHAPVKRSQCLPGKSSVKACNSVHRMLRSSGCISRTCLLLLLPCCPQVPAVFEGLVSYKNGMKGVVATQVGLLQFNNFALGDNGAGPRAHIVNGKDNGAQMELTWVLDDRNRDAPDIRLADMSGAQHTCCA